MWGEIESFLNNPESVIGELSSLLRGRLGEGVGESDLFHELEELRAEAAGKEGERNALYRLFRKGMLPETDLESQPSELREGESAIGSRLEKVKRTVEKSKDARSSLDGARATLKQQSVELIASAWRLERHQPEFAKDLHPQWGRIRGKPHYHLNCIMLQAKAISFSSSFVHSPTAPVKIRLRYLAAYTKWCCVS